MSEGNDDEMMPPLPEGALDATGAIWTAIIAWAQGQEILQAPAAIDAAITDLCHTYAREHAAQRCAELVAEVERLTIRGAAYEAAYGVAHRATYQSHNGHWDSTMRGGLGCRECIRAKEAREECDNILRRGLEKLAARAILTKHKGS